MVQSINCWSFGEREVEEEWGAKEEMRGEKKKKSTNLPNLSGFLSSFPRKTSPVAHSKPFPKAFPGFFDLNICFPLSSLHSPELSGYMAVRLWSLGPWLAARCKLFLLKWILGNEEIYIPSFFTLFVTNLPSRLTWGGPALPWGLPGRTGPV